MLGALPDSDGAIVGDVEQRVPLGGDRVAVQSRVPLGPRIGCVLRFPLDASREGRPIRWGPLRCSYIKKLSEDWDLLLSRGTDKYPLYFARWRTAAGSPQLIKCLGPRQPSPRYIPDALKLLYTATSYKSYRADFLGGSREGHHVPHTSPPGLDLLQGFKLLPNSERLYRGNMRYCRDRGDPVSSDMCDSSHLFGINLDCMPTILAEEYRLKAILARGHYDGIDLHSRSDVRAIIWFDRSSRCTSLKSFSKSPGQRWPGGDRCRLCSR